MNILQSIVYGFVSGLSAFLPISSRGHQELLKAFFGVSSPEPLRDLMIHIALLCAVWISCGTYIEKLRRELRSVSAGRGRRDRHRDRRTFYDMRFLKNAAFPMLAVMLIFRMLVKSGSSLAGIAFFFLLNGILIFIPEYLPHGNKDTKTMSALDAFLTGLVGGLSVLPGISGVGASVSCAVARGADKTKAYGWILVLSIPAILLWILFDIVSFFVTGIGVLSFLSVLGYILSAIFAFISAMAGIYLMRFIAVRSGFSAFAFYSWGAALLSFLLYLTA